MFIAMTTGRLIHWMVAKEYCVDWRLGWFFRLLRADSGRPRRRRFGRDQACHSAGVATGKLVGMLPEGRINTTGELLLPGRPGVVLVALEGASADRSLLHPRAHRMAARRWGHFFGRRMFACSSAIRSIYRNTTIGKRIPEMMAELTKRCLSAIARLGRRRGFRAANRRPPLEARRAGNTGVINAARRRRACRRRIADCWRRQRSRVTARQCRFFFS